MDKQMDFVLRTIEERGVKFVRLWFTDVIGTLKSLAIAPAEVEAVLRTHDGVADAYVVGVPDARLDETLAAVIVSANAEPPDLDDLRAHCRRLLSAYKTPRHFKFVLPDDLPLTSTGKLQKNRLVDIFQ